MKLRICFFVLFLSVVSYVLPNTLFAQENEPNQVRCNSECVSTVRALLKTVELGYSDSFLEKQNDRLGDKVAFALREIYATDELADLENIKFYLPVIEESFISTHLITEDLDKKPTHTLELLEEVNQKLLEGQQKQEIRGLIKDLELKLKDFEEKQIGK